MVPSAKQAKTVAPSFRRSTRFSTSTAASSSKSDLNLIVDRPTTTRTRSQSSRIIEEIILDCTGEKEAVLDTAAVIVMDTNVVEVEDNDNDQPFESEDSEEAGEESSDILTDQGEAREESREEANEFDDEPPPSPPIQGVSKGYLSFREKDRKSVV